MAIPKIKCALNSCRRRARLTLRVTDPDGGRFWTGHEAVTWMEYDVCLRHVGSVAHGYLIEGFDVTVALTESPP